MYEVAPWETNILVSITRVDKHMHHFGHNFFRNLLQELLYKKLVNHFAFLNPHTCIYMYSVPPKLYIES